jgi:hypothetical protein
LQTNNVQFHKLTNMKHFALFWSTIRTLDGGGAADSSRGIKAKRGRRANLMHSSASSQDYRPNPSLLIIGDTCTLPYCKQSKSSLASSNRHRSTMQHSEEAFRRPRIAVVGCGHGGLDTIYADLAVKFQTQGQSVSDLDLLIICGDFQVSILLVV